jgi:hypothetical protein
MATERKWDRIPPRAFALDGGADGSVYLITTRNFKVKQKVAISATGLPDLSLEVKKVISPTQMLVGPVSSKMTERQNLSEYTLDKNPKIRAEEQDRPGIPTEQHERYVYAEEPIMAKRVISVDEYGNYYSESNPLTVKLSEDSPLVLENVQVDLDGVSTEQKQIEGNAYLSTINESVSKITPNPFAPPEDSDSFDIENFSSLIDIVHYRKEGIVLKSVKLTYKTTSKNDILSAEIL